MSYDVQFEEMQMTDVGDHHNFTWNCGPMFRLALGGDGINSLNGRIAGDAIELLQRALDHMRAPENRATYEAMNPSNGWGDHESATRFVESLLADAKAHPLSTIRTS